MAIRRQSLPDLTNRIFPGGAHQKDQLPIMPALFVSHGTPMMALVDESEDPYVAALAELGRTLPKPKAIVVVSAHQASGTEPISVNSSPTLKAFHDFGGFPGELYLCQYDAVGSPALAAEIMGLLASANLDAALVSSTTIDHGVWVPLMKMYPAANVPIVQVSLPFPDQPQITLKLGQALSVLRKKGVLILGSGGAVHNLPMLKWFEKGSEGDRKAKDFEQWLIDCLKKKDVESLLDFENEAPHPVWAHPTAEHLYPLFFTVGAALEGDDAHVLIRGIEYSSLSMLSFLLA